MRITPLAILTSKMNKEDARAIIDADIKMTHPK